MDIRNWVYDALIAVILKGTYSNLYLKDHLNELPEKSRPLATRIFYGTIQNYALCKYVWEKFTQKMPDPKIQVLLSMTVYQIIFLKKVPDYAAVDDAVKIAHKRFGKASGFVNGVLRNIIRNKAVLPENPLEKLAIRYSVPLWLVHRWDAQYGFEKTKQLCSTSNAVLPVYVRPNLKRITPEEFFADPQITRYNDEMGIFTGTDVSAHPFYRSGRMSVQDPGSYMISKFMDVQPDDSVLDVCAAPGTKTMAMAEKLDGGHVDALDLHEHRVQLIENDARRLHLKNVKAAAGDATELSAYPVYDRVLADVPCSGYGVFARKPDIKLRAKPEDMDELIPLQARIVDEASQHVAAGGTLVYSTCTINKKENEKQVARFLENHPEFRLDDEQTVFPDETHNGFYMARMIRDH